LEVGGSDVSFFAERHILLLKRKTFEREKWKWEEEEEEGPEKKKKKGEVSSLWYLFTSVFLLGFL
jgi:hypothetical protein